MMQTGLVLIISMGRFNPYAESYLVNGVKRV